MAKLAGKQTLEINEMSQEIDLKRYLKRDATPQEKIAFIERAIEKINNRTLDHKTIHGGRFKRYSEEYAKEKGVGVNDVDLFLEGDMLGSLDGKIKDETNKVKIFLDGELQTKKGFNHHTGDTQKKRPWFGITTKEAKEIANEIKQEEQQQQLQSDVVGVLDGETITQTTLAEIISGIRLVNNGG